MDETLVRELVARREEPRLDFKESPHDTNDELAKDLMAMANILGPSARAHILLGVRERPDGTGEIIGGDVGRLGDAEFQQKVKMLFNRVPRFTFGSIQVDGKSVGVFEIEGTGHRPFYPLRDAGVLKRFVPLKRVGTSTDVASPDEVLEWKREDQPSAQPWHELRRIPADARVRVLARYGPVGARPMAPDGASLFGLFKGIDESQSTCTFLMEGDRRQLHIPLQKVGLVWIEGLEWKVQVHGTVREAQGTTQWSFSPDTSW
jgi:Putative DNA-binding domain